MQCLLSLSPIAAPPPHVCAHVISSSISTSQSVGFGQTFTNQTVAFYDVLYRLLNVMDATINHTDCSCTAIDIPEGTGCSLRVAYCVYMLPEDNSKPFPKNPTLMYRARVWDLEHPEYTGSSEGYKNISAGATNPEDAQLDAANDLRKNFPARSCGELEPLVMVPGFSSSEIQYVVKHAIYFMFCHELAVCFRVP